MTQARRTSGGPVLQDEVTHALTEAFFAELAEAGYGRLSLEAVAKRANAGKAAIYRRWPSKRAMTVELASAAAVAATEAPDTGALRTDLLEFLADAVAALTHPLASRIVPDLIAEATRDPELADALVAAVRAPRRDNAARILHRAMARGELPAGLSDADLELGLDFLAGPLYWRLAITHMSLDDDYLPRLVDRTLLALRGPA